VGNQFTRRIDLGTKFMRDVPDYHCEMTKGEIKTNKNDSEIR
jgi:hypothetical protein